MLVSSSHPSVLLVEGGTDQDLVDGFRDAFNKFDSSQWISTDFEIMNMKGVDKLVGSVSTVLKAPKRRVVGMIVDADHDAGERWNTLKSELSNCAAQLGLDFPIPEEPQLGGTIIEFPAKIPRVGIWIMPDNVSSGALEDFVVRMIRPDDKIWPLSEKYIDGIPFENRKFSPGNPRKIVKAKVNAWLAAGEWPAPLHEAVKGQDLDIGVSICKDFAFWLSRLFG